MKTSAPLLLTLAATLLLGACADDGGMWNFRHHDHDHDGDHHDHDGDHLVGAQTLHGGPTPPAITVGR